MCIAAPAAAQEAAAAEAQFESGLSAMKAGDYDTACPAIAESQRLEPRPGTLFTLAECWRKAGKTATALARYDEYLRSYARMTADQRAKQRGRNKFAKRSADALRGRVPRLVIRLAVNSARGATVERDGVALGKPSLGRPLPVDPGEHTLVARAPDGNEVTRTVALRAGETKTVTLSIQLSEKKRQNTKTAPRPALSPTPDNGAASSNASTQRILGYVSLGVGAAGLAVGAVSGALVFNKKSTIKDNCGSRAGLENGTCTARGKSAADSASTLATVSNIGFGVGIIGLGAGTTLLLTAPSSARVPRSKPHGLFLGIQGRL